MAENGRHFSFFRYMYIYTFAHTHYIYISGKIEVVCGGS